MTGANTAGVDSVRFFFANQGFTITETNAVVNGIDPIVLDLGEPGFAFSPLATGVQFDIDGDGAADQVAWTTGDDGILAYDLDGSGQIENGTEIFTPVFAGGNHASGLAALATLDGNGDGVIDSADVLNDLVVWRDLNHNGISEAGELTSLADYGITAINLTGTPVDVALDGHQVLLGGTFSYSDGTTGRFIEVALDVALGSTSPSTSPLVAGEGNNAPDVSDSNLLLDHTGADTGQHSPADGIDPGAYVLTQPSAWPVYDNAGDATMTQADAGNTMAGLEAHIASQTTQLQSHFILS